MVLWGGWVFVHSSAVAWCCRKIENIKWNAGSCWTLFSLVSFLHPYRRWRLWLPRWLVRLWYWFWIDLLILCLLLFLNYGLISWVFHDISKLSPILVLSLLLISVFDITIHLKINQLLVCIYQLIPCIGVYHWQSLNPIQILVKFITVSHSRGVIYYAQWVWNLIYLVTEIAANVSHLLVFWLAWVWSFMAFLRQASLERDFLVVGKSVLLLLHWLKICR